MPESKTLQFPFIHKGLVNAIEPAKLASGQYPYMVNMTSAQEGCLSTRKGRKRLGSSPSGAHACHMIRKLEVFKDEVPGTPSLNPRYVGLAYGSHADIFRTTDYSSFGTPVVEDVNDPSEAEYIGRRWSLAKYSAGASGSAWAYIAGGKKMVKDTWTNSGSPYSSLPNWGVPVALGVATAQVSSADGVLDGGDTGSPAQSQPYDYLFCYVSAEGNEGNPSQPMLESSQVSTGVPAACNLKYITVTVWGTDDTISYPRIAIYRRGGILYDAYRLVGYVANPGVSGGVPLSQSFDDNTADSDLQYQKLVEFDHDPPVTSSLPTPWLSTAAASIAGTQWQVLEAGRAIPSDYEGSTLVITTKYGVQRCVIAQVVGNLYAKVYLQYPVASGDLLSIDSVTGQPSHLAITAFDSVFIAGDPNNPHILYKSKTGQPEYFPLQTDGGLVNQIGVGSPANKILNITEFRGSILCLNSSSLFEVPVSKGVMTGPNITPAKRGLAAAWAWCQAENEIWYLAYDGIWSWDGSVALKRTEAIDPVFRGEKRNGVEPVNYDPQYLRWAQMEYCQGKIRLLYRSTNGANVLVYSPVYDRWEIEDPSINPGPQIITTMFQEPDTLSLIYGRENGPTNTSVFSLAESSAASGNDNYTTDEYSIIPPINDGNQISFDFYTPWFDLGIPHVAKLIKQIWLEVDPQIYGGRNYLANIGIDVMINYSTATVDHPGIDRPPGVTDVVGRKVYGLNLQNTAVAGAYYAFGREVQSIQFRFYGYAYPTQIHFYSIIIAYEETGALLSGGNMGWDTLGTEHDKRLYQIRVVYDVMGTDRELIMDTLSGRNGMYYTEAAQSFTLSATSQLPVPGGALCTASFPIKDGTIVKSVRLRQNTIGPYNDVSVIWAKIQSVTFDKEEYPPDLVTTTPWEDGGFAYDKYAQEVVLSVNTNQVAVTVVLQADGVDKFTFQVNSTEKDRNRRITCPPGLSGRRWRLYVDPSQTSLGAVYQGMFQLFSHAISFQKADPGEVGHTYDWDMLDHPWDKRAFTVTFEWNNPTASNIELRMDTLSGINGGTLNSDITRFVLEPGRHRKPFSIPTDTIFKMVRIYPVGPTLDSQFRQWFKYYFDKVNYPADVVSSTDWRDFGSPHDKNPNSVWIDADTENVAAVVLLQNESGTVLTMAHNKTRSSRKGEYACNPDTSGKMWRLVAVPGPNGKFQLFDWGIEGTTDPPDGIAATPWNDFGWPCDKTARNLDITVDTGGVPVVVNLEADGVIKQTVTIMTTYTDRKRVIALPTGLTGILWRLRPALPLASGAKFKLWNWSIQPVKEPCAVSSWTSLQQSFGYKGWKLITQVWIEYSGASPVTLSLTSDTGVYSVTLPAAPVKSVYRCYPDTVWGAGFNKSKLYQIDLSSSGSFKLYRDSSGVEWIGFGNDRHAALQQMPLSSFMDIGETG